MPILAERMIQREILRYLHARGILCWKAGVGAIYGTYKEKDRYIRFGIKGQPDIIGILPGGRFLGIEVKSLLGKITPDQHAFLHLIRNAGGVGFMARSVKEVHDTLDPLIAEELTTQLTQEARHGTPQPVARDAAPAPGYDPRTRYVPPPGR